MQSFATLKFFATALLVTVLAGPVIQRLLPGWSALAEGVGSGGAWFASILYHLVYGIIIGVGAALTTSLTGRVGRALSQPGVALAALVSVLLFDTGFVLLKPDVQPFAWLALILLLISFMAHLLVALVRVRQGERAVSGE